MFKPKFILPLLFLLFALFPTPSLAAGTDFSQTLRISPIIMRIELSPGKVTEEIITVENLLDTPLPVSAHVEGFDSSDEENGIKMSAEETTSPLTDWITISDPDSIIPAGSTKGITVTITVPAEISLGGYYAMIFFTPTFPTGDTQTQSLVSAKVGVLALANIGVDALDSQAEVVTFTTSQKIYQKNPIKTTLRIKNTGLNYFSTKPQVTFQSLFGGEKVFDLDEKTILPGKIRRWENTFSFDNFYSAFYSVKLSSSLENGKYIYSNLYIFGFPLTTVLVLTFLAIVLGYSLLHPKRLLKALRLIFPLLIFFVVFSSPAKAFTNNFNATITEEVLTHIVTPGHSYNLSIRALTSDPSQTVYPVALKLVNSTTYSLANTWVTFSHNSYTLTNTNDQALDFTLTIPSDAETGEYTTAVGISDTPFADGISSNPATVLAIPLVIQVSGGITPTPTPTPTATITPAATTTPTTAPTATSTPTTASTPTPTSWLNVPTPIELPTFDNEKPLDLFSKITLINFAPRYRFLSPSQTFTMTLQNNGNISAFPKAIINLKNHAARTLAVVPFDIKEPLKPNEEKTYAVSYRPNQFLIGQFQAELYLGYQNSKVDLQPFLVTIVPFFLLSQVPLLILIFTLVSLVLIWLFKTPHRFVLQRYAYTLIILPLTAALIIQGYQSSQSPSLKSLGTTTNLDVSTEIQKTIGLKTIINLDLSRDVIFTNQNPIGAELWSLQNNTRIPLKSLVTHTEAVSVYTLTGNSTQYPQLMITKGY